MSRRPFLRDLVFYLAAAGWTFAVMYKKDIHTAEAVGFIILYVLYVSIAVVGQYINRSLRRKQGESQRLILADRWNDDLSEIPLNVTHVIDDLNANADFTSYNYSVDHAHDLKHKIHTPSQKQKPEVLGVQAYVIVNQDLTESIRIHNDKINLTLLEMLSGINKSEWPHQSVISKIYSIIKIPIMIALSLTCPLVDRGVQGEKWNKWLSLILCMLTPLFCVFGVNVNVGFIVIYKEFVFWHLMLIVSVLIIAVTHFTTSFNTAPKFHFVYAFIGFAMAVVWIRIITQEIVNLLETFGWIFNLSYGIMGLTLLAWGNSIGDFISNLTMARHGAPRMAIAACYGGPLLTDMIYAGGMIEWDMLLGTGISCTISAIKNHGDKKLIRGTTQYILSASFLSLSLLSALVILPFNRFQSSKFIGFFLILLYIAYMLLSILHETDIY